MRKSCGLVYINGKLILFRRLRKINNGYKVELLDGKEMVVQRNNIKRPPKGVNYEDL